MTTTLRTDARQRLARAIGVFGGVALLGAIGVSAAPPPSSPKNEWNTLIADVTVQVSTHDSDEPASAPAPRTATYHWELTDTPAGTKSRMTPTSTPSARITTKAGDVELADSMPLVVVEDDGDGTPLRVLDRHGKPISLTPEQRRRFDALADSGGMPGRATRASMAQSLGQNVGARRRSLSNLVIEAAQNSTRRRSLTAHFGASKGQVRNLSRFVRSDGERTTEALADPSTGVVLEMAVADKGALVSHTTFEYVALPGGQMVRRNAHSERVVPGEVGRRVVTDVLFDNVRLERRVER